MRPAHRWGIVGVLVLLLAATPVLVRALPVADADVSAVGLLHRVQDSRDASFHGYAETVGNVALPRNDTLSSVTKLFGETSHVRVWWQDPQHWRVATLRPTGETDLVHRGDRMVRWTYESRSAATVPDVHVRLPITTDLLPHELARRSLAGARGSELSRLPARRVAGRTALGLRLTPADAQSAVRHVDVYADRSTGVPLRVDVFAKGQRTAAVTSRFVDFSPGRPAPSLLRFTAPADAHRSFDGFVDIASAVDRFASRVPPETLAGLPTRDRLHGSVGVYGRGPTALLALPLWSRSGDRVRADLESRPGVRTVDQGLLLGATPVHLLLADPEPNGTSWLLAGTVTPQALEDAADELAAHRPSLQGQP
jgi:hypothetical protein